MSRSLGVWLLAGAMAASVSRAAVITDAPAATEPASTEPAAATKPVEIKVRLVDLFRADLRDRRLVVAMVPPPAGLAPAGGSAPSILVEGISDDRWFLEAGAEDRRADGSYATFSASCDDRMDDRYGSLRLTQVSGGDSISVVGAGRAGDRWVQVSFTQDAKTGNVRFTVQRPRRRFPRPLHEFEGEDLLQLWNEHPAELRQFLLPLFKEMCGKDLLRPRAGDVYRAFASIAADPAIVQKLAAILPGLDADSASERAAASEKLTALGPAGILAAVRIDRSQLTAEQRGRLDALVQNSSIWLDPAEVAGHDPLFLAECLDDPDMKVRVAALQSLRTLTGRTIAFDADAEPEKRAKAAAAVVDSLEDLAAPAAAGFNP